MLVYVRVCLCAFMCACVVSSTAGAGVGKGGQQNVEEGARGLRVQAAAWSRFCDDVLVGGAVHISVHLFFLVASEVCSDARLFPWKPYQCLKRAFIEPL